MPELPPPAAAGTWAEVHARDQVVRYRRSGTGAVVLLLGAGHGHIRWAGLEPALGRHGRVMVPDLGDPDDQPVERRLGAFLEGIGATAVSVLVVQHAVMAPVLTLALREPELIGRVAIVADGIPADAPQEATLAGGARPAPLPLLLLARALPSDEALPALVRFLCPGDGGCHG
jgi:hypothetical protein